MMLMAAVSTSALTYTQASRESLFLTDKMAYELRLSDTQYDAVYEINLDYFMSVSSSSNIYGTAWTRRNLDMSYVLTAAQYNLYVTSEYFYYPVYWSSGLKYRIYSRYTDSSHFYYSRPSVYSTYRGGHSWSSNGGKSWYKGRTFSNGKTMTVVRSGHSVKTVTSSSKTVNKRTTGRTGTSNHSASTSTAKGHSTKTTKKTSTSTSGRRVSGTTAKPSSATTSKPSATHTKNTGRTHTKTGGNNGGTSKGNSTVRFGERR